MPDPINLFYIALGSIICVQLRMIYTQLGSYGARLDGHDRELGYHSKRIERLEDE